MQYKKGEGMKYNDYPDVLKTNFGQLQKAYAQKTSVLQTKSDRKPIHGFLPRVKKNSIHSFNFADVVKEDHLLSYLEQCATHYSVVISVIKKKDTHLYDALKEKWQNLCGVLATPIVVNEYNRVTMQDFRESVMMLIRSLLDLLSAIIEDLKSDKLAWDKNTIVSWLEQLHQFLSLIVEIIVA